MAGRATVPQIDLKAQYAQIGCEIDAAIRRVVESQQFVLGPEVEGFEREIAGYCGVSFAVGCASGSDAILLALMAHDIGPGDEVICPAYSFFATAGSIARLGALPVFADVDPRSLNVTVETLSSAVARCRRPAAIVAVDLFGEALEMGAVLALAADLGVPLIEDAAQAFAARDAEGRATASRASMGCLSFFPSKNLGGYGDGGMLTSDDAERIARVRLLRDHGADARRTHELVGLNSRLDALQAAVLQVKLAHVERWIASRRRIAKTYDELLHKAGGAAGPGDFAGLALAVRTPLAPPEPARHVFSQYVIRVPEAARDPLRAFLAEEGVESAIYYRAPLHLQPCFRYLGHGEGELPIAERAARENLALPIYAELEDEQIALVVDLVCRFFER